MWYKYGSLGLFFTQKNWITCLVIKNKKCYLVKKGVNWNDYKIKYKRGLVVKRHVITQMSPLNEEITRSKWIPDYITPIFHKIRNTYKINPN
jgi:hypothetical protein